MNRTVGSKGQPNTPIQVPQAPAPPPLPPEIAKDRREPLVRDQAQKGDDYSQQLESVLNDVKYSSSAADSYRAEQELGALRGQYMNDPKITVNELGKLDQAIDAVRAIRRGEDNSCAKIHCKSGGD